MTAPAQRRVASPGAAPSDPAAPFFYTAPAAVACAGGVLLVHGERALLDSWSPVTMGLTHFATLGFVTMTGIGAFYRLAPSQLDQPAPGRWLALLTWLGFTIGIGSLCIGLTGGFVAPVFVAIGALFPALATFFLPAIRLLRRTRGHPAAGPWWLAVGAFFAVAALGIWVAHGHGGMAFPGPRSLWVQLHLSIALFGWVGAVATASLQARLTDCSATAPPLLRGWSMLGGVGVVLCVLVLAVDYVGAFDVSPNTARTVGLLAAAPAAFATAIVSTKWGFAGLALAPPNAVARDEALLWRVAFALGPVTLVCAGLAIAVDDATSRVMFGWIAVWGWAGAVTLAMLYSLAPLRLPASTILGLHATTLALGLVATAAGSNALALATGVALVALAAALIPRRRTA